MGAKQHKVQCERSDDCLTQLMNPIQPPNNHLGNLLARFTSNIKFQQQVKINYRGKQIWITQSIVRLYTFPSFLQKAVEYYLYLVNYLQKLLDKKAMIFITSDQWKLCYGLTQFVMLCCDQEIMKFMNQPDRIVYTNPQQMYGEMQGLLQKKIQPLTHVQDILTSVQKSMAIKTFKNFMYFSVCMKNKLISDFSSTFTMIYASVESLLCLYAKIEKDFTSREAFKRNIYTAAYSIGLGIQYQHPATVNLAVKIITKIVIGQQKTLQQIIKIDSIPSHNFQQIPLFTCSNIYETISTYLVYILCHKSDQVHIQPIIKLLMKMIVIFRPRNKQFSYYLQRLCKSETGKIQTAKILKILRKYQQAELKKTQIIQKFININESVSESQVHTNDYLQFTQNNLRSAEIDSMAESKKSQYQKQQSIIDYEKQIINIYHKITIKKFMPQIKIQQLQSKPLSSIKTKTQGIVPQMKQADEAISQKHMIKSRELAIQEYTQQG